MKDQSSCPERILPRQFENLRSLYVFPIVNVNCTSKSNKVYKYTQYLLEFVQRGLICDFGKNNGSKKGSNIDLTYERFIV